MTDFPVAIAHVQRDILRCYSIILTEQHNWKPSLGRRSGFGGTLPVPIGRLHDASWRHDLAHGLVTIAASLRVAADRMPGNPFMTDEAAWFEVLNGDVLHRTLREACNKIIHAKAWAFLRVEPARHVSGEPTPLDHITAGPPLGPRAEFRGTQQVNGSTVPWTVGFDVRDFLTTAAAAASGFARLSAPATPTPATHMRSTETGTVDLNE